MVTAAVIALAATASTGQVVGRGTWAPWSPWTDGVQSQLNSPTNVTVAENGPFTVSITGTDWDQYVQYTSATVKTYKEIGNWQTVRGRVGYATASIGTTVSYSNGSGGDVTIKFLRRGRTYNNPAGGYPVTGVDSYEVFDGQDNQASSNNPGYVLWDSNVSEQTVTVAVNQAQ